MRVVLASGNQGKLTELSSLLAPLDVELVSQTALGIGSCEEPFDTFIENALTKARHASAEASLAAIADDSGLVVQALNGEPGVRSARFAGDNASDAQNSAHLITRLREHSPEQSQFDAHYYCAMVFLQHANDPAPIVACAQWHGQIQLDPAGESGFGYDPYFYVPELKQTAAQLTKSEKNKISHRGRAIQTMLPALKAALQCGN